MGDAGIGRMRVQWSANAQELSTCAGGKGVKGEGSGSDEKSALAPISLPSANRSLAATPRSFGLPAFPLSIRLTLSTLRAWAGS